MDVLGKANLRDTVNFSLYSRTQAIININFNGSKILAKLDAESVPAGSVDPYALHANVFGTLPEGTPSSADDYNWLKIRLANGNTTYIGEPYILASTLTVVDGATVAFYVDNANQDVINAVTAAIATTGNKVAKVVFV